MELDSFLQARTSRISLIVAILSLQILRKFPEMSRLGANKIDKTLWGIACLTMVSRHSLCF